ncbi:hypothetical protein [Calothrix sp. UHCC 0171]|nr:hypothetical protein [Calothrix sp. UHCC 0171]MEA5574174.1 hypothetical protein [Calothrix sp. UHCC 0171]
MTTQSQVFPVLGTVGTWERERRVHEYKSHPIKLQNNNYSTG